MKTWMTVVGLVVVVVLTAAGWLFWVQNSGQQVPVSFEIWGVGRYGRVWKAPELMAISFGVGALLVGLPAIVSSIRLRGRLRRLEQQAKVSDGASTSNWR